jgi:hypothetical protein
MTQWSDRYDGPDMQNNKKTCVLTEAELLTRAQGSPEAWDALQRCDEIKGRGRRPVITYSEVSGYRVFGDRGVKPRPQG